MAESVKKPRTIKVTESEPIRTKTIRSRALEVYEHDDKNYLAEELDISSIKTVPELVALVESDEGKNIEIEAIVYGAEKGTGRARPFKLNKTQFVEAFKKNSRKKTFRESVDFFGSDMSPIAGGVGEDYTPLLGGPFNKQLYLYDYLKMHAICFQASTHDPILRTAVDIINDFVLGRGFRVDCDNKAALALWRAFEEVNDLQNYIRNFNRELTIYGEQFVWWLPNNETKIGYQLPTQQAPPKGVIPRIRPLDPSTVWEIVTYPEDITRKLYAQLVFPTQYQIYTGSDQGRPVQSTKFIYQQIPADQFDHYKVNAVTNEKRGRSDLFPVLGYAKRLRDSVNYSIIGLQKSTAWSIDTEIDGNEQDIANYVSSQEAIGTIPPPGSEFVHGTKVKRQYLSNEGSSKAGGSQAFDWCFSMICSGLGIPQNYFATHLNGGSTRASAVVATEPVTKKFEMRQQLIERVIKDMAKRLFKQFGITDADIEVTFPELVTQDRSAKLKDLAMAEQMGWLSSKTVAAIAAKELGVTKYDWKTEQELMKEEPQSMPITSPLTAPSLSDAQPDKNSSLTGEQRKAVKDERGF